MATARQGEESLDESLGFANAIGFTVVVCFMIKLNAIAMQQKLIGERMGSSVKVRAMIGPRWTSCALSHIPTFPEHRPV